METLVVGSTEANAGRKLIIWALGEYGRKRRLSVGFLKPRIFEKNRGAPRERDEEVMLLKEAMGIGEPLEVISPEVFLEEGKEKEGAVEVAEFLRSHIARACRGKDLVFVMGGKNIFLDDSSSMVSDMALVRALGAHFVLVAKFQDIPRTLYSILTVISLLGDRVAAIVINRIPPREVGEVQREVTEKLGQGQIVPIFFIPEDQVLGSRTLKQILRMTGGELLVGGQRLDEPIGGCTIGGSELLSGELSPIKRLYNRVLLLKPEEPDSKDRKTIAAIGVTSGRRPPQVLLDLATRMQLPLFLTQEDALSLLERLEKSPPPLSPTDHRKASRMLSLLEENRSLEALFLKMDLSS